jgi:hypothetical protein
MEEERFSGTAVWVFSVVDRYIDGSPQVIESYIGLARTR